MVRKRLDTLNDALKMEEERKTFYEKARNETNNEMGRKMFESLGRSKEAHIERIKHLYKVLEETGKWPDTVVLSRAEESMKNTCALVIKSLSEKVKGTTDEIAALKLAMEKEDNGVKYYQCLADTTEDLFEKKFYLLMVHEETEHWLSLLDSIEYLEDPEGYFHQKEMIHSTFM